MLFGPPPVVRRERARGAVLSAAAHLTLGLIAVAAARYQPAEAVDPVDTVRPPGNGVSWPRLLRDMRPANTADARRARIAGSVGLSCIVDRDGSVRDCVRVTIDVDFSRR